MGQACLLFHLPTNNFSTFRQIKDLLSVLKSKEI